MIILLQGAMNIEIDKYISFYHANERMINGYKFYIGEYKNNKIVISLTNMGVKHADVATTIGINEFKPDVIISSGVCGSHDKHINVGEIVIANKATFLNTKELKIEVEATDRLLNLIKDDKQLNNVKFITFGSGDFFSTDVKKIIKLRNYFSHDTEDMETISSFFEAKKNNIEHIAIRIISNNELLNQKYEDNIDKVKDKIQDYVIKFIEKLISI